MKKLLTIAALSMLAVSTWAQGIVDFRNGGITFRTVADRNVYLGQVGGTLLKGNNWVAQLYYVEGATQTGAALAAVDGAPIPFRATTSTGVGGVWVTLTPQRTLLGVGEGETATLQVRIWDITKFASYDAAVAGGGQVGVSERFNYTVPAAGNPPDAYYMDNLRAFAVVPEPSTIALGVLGLGSLLLFRRRK